MNDRDFKNWFEGFCAAINGVPNVQQWEMIKEKVKSINNTDLYLDKSQRPYKEIKWPPNWKYPQPKFYAGDMVNS